MKIFNTLDKILEFTGCDVAIPTNHPLGKYAVFEVVEPYNCKYLDWATELGILQLDIFVRGKTLIAYLPKYSEIGEKENMEKYIASYKHLIGCEVEFNKHTHIFNGTYEFKYLFKSSPKYFLKNLKFYLDDGTHVNDSATLGTYGEYMQLYYPEYEHIWKHQL